MTNLQFLSLGFLLLLILLLRPIKAEEEVNEAPNDIIILGDDDFETEIKNFKNALVMFHAPWCGHCKRLAPEFAKAATILKDDTPHPVVLIKVDCTEAGKSICKDNGVRGYPTLKIFRDGEIAAEYKGPRESDGIVKYIQTEVAALDSPKKEKKLEENIAGEKEEGEAPSDVIILGDDDFEAEMKKLTNALVMFHAPWCGHCKRLAPEYAKAATILKDDTPHAVSLVKVDCTAAGKSICGANSVRGYPTLKIFRNGEFAAEYKGPRDTEGIVKYIRTEVAVLDDPKKEKKVEEKKANEEEEEAPSDVIILGDDDFETEIKKLENALVMFHAPWCGHCKRLAPEYAKAASILKDDTPHAVSLVKVDCTVAGKSTCGDHSIRGYPTLKIFRNGEVAAEYKGPRETDGIVKYIRTEVAALRAPKEEKTEL